MNRWLERDGWLALEEPATSIASVDPGADARLLHGSRPALPEPGRARARRHRAAGRVRRGARGAARGGQRGCHSWPRVATREEAFCGPKAELGARPRAGVEERLGSEGRRAHDRAAGQRHADGMHTQDDAFVLVRGAHPDGEADVQDVAATALVGARARRGGPRRPGARVGARSRCDRWSRRTRRRSPPGRIPASTPSTTRRPMPMTWRSCSTRSARGDDFYAADGDDGRLAGYFQLKPGPSGSRSGSACGPTCAAAGSARRSPQAGIELVRRVHGERPITLAVAAFNAARDHGLRAVRVRETGRHMRHTSAATGSSSTWSCANRGLTPEVALTFVTAAFGATLGAAGRPGRDVESTDAARARLRPGQLRQDRPPARPVPRGGRRGSRPAS